MHWTFLDLSQGFSLKGVGKEWWFDFPETWNQTSQPGWGRSAVPMGCVPLVVLWVVLLVERSSGLSCALAWTCILVGRWCGTGSQKQSANCWPVPCPDWPDGFVFYSCLPPGTWSLLLSIDGQWTHGHCSWRGNHCHWGWYDNRGGWENAL